LEERPGYQDPGIRFSGVGKIYGIITKDLGKVKKTT
jgi:hypothetical protein